MKKKEINESNSINSARDAQINDHDRAHKKLTKSVNDLCDTLDLLAKLLRNKNSLSKKHFNSTSENINSKTISKRVTIEQAIIESQTNLTLH